MPTPLSSPVRDDDNGVFIVPGANRAGLSSFTRMDHSCHPSRPARQRCSKPSSKLVIESNRTKSVSTSVEREEQRSAKRSRKLQRRQRRQMEMELSSSSEEDTRDSSVHQLGCRALKVSSHFVRPIVDVTPPNFNSTDVVFSSEVATASVLKRSGGDVVASTVAACQDTPPVEGNGMVTEKAVEKVKRIEKRKSLGKFFFCKVNLICFVAVAQVT